MLLKDKIKADVEKKNIEQHIASTANSIAKCLFGHYLFKRRIKKIYE
jgi:hypothetical protein